MTKSRASTEGAAVEAVTAPATEPKEADPSAQATTEPKPPATAPVASPTEQDAFPSQHIMYLGVVRNELEASIMRFRNGHEMLRAKIEGTQTAHTDEMRTLDEEYKRKRQERIDSHLNEILRLKVQSSDLADVIETYEAAIGKIGEIAQRQAQAEAATNIEGALK